MQKLQTKRELSVTVKEQPVTLISGITFAQVPYWFPFYNYRDLKLDLLLPFGRSNEKRPLLVWICGGGFVTMERSAYIPWLSWFAKKGYVTASIEYRLSNSAHFPAPVEDAKKAIRYLRAHADEYGIDPAKVVIGGESAGGNLASMTGVTNGLAEFEKGEYLEQSSSVSAVINYYGPTSLGKAKRDEKSFDGIPLPETTASSSLIQYLGFHPGEEPERAAKSTAQYYVNQDTVPFFMAHGTADSLVDISASDAFYDVLVQNHVPVEYYRIQGAGHMGMEFYQDEMCQRIHDFLEKVFAG